MNIINYNKADRIGTKLKHEILKLKKEFDFIAPSLKIVEFFLNS